MIIPYTEFEQYIDETILSRGLKYFKKGHVSAIEEVSPNKFEATVQGSEEYTVNIKLSENNLTDYYCNCPYDHGPVCKHIAAVLFHMQQDHLGIQVSKPKKNDNTKTKRKTVADKVIDTINELSHEELKQFIIDRANRDRNFRETFLTSFAYKTEKESTAFYKKLVKSILKSHSYQGFIHYSSSRKVASEVRELLEQAQNNLENCINESAFYMATGIMEEIVKALQFSDDSSGEIGGTIYEACDILHQISDNFPTEKTRKMLFDYCIKAYEKDKYSGWDWHLDMLQIASNCFEGDKEYKILMKHVEKEHNYEYMDESLEVLKYQILSKAEGEESANEFLFDKLSNSHLRTIALQLLFEKRDYTRAKEIAQDGILKDKENKPGLIIDWNNWLLRIAQATNDKDEVIRIARNILITNSSRHPIEEYYNILKGVIKDDEWIHFIDQIILYIKTKPHWRNNTLIADIYILEENWEYLLNFIKESDLSNSIEHYEQYLAKPYPNELSELYTEYVKDYLVHNVGRNYYKSACRYIRRIIKLGNRDMATELITYLRKEYPTRRALLEELENV